MAGYHVKRIKKGTYGEFSKIVEEVEEFHDATKQGNKIMAITELSDVIGAISGYLEKHFPDFSLEDLVIMAEATKRAFETGERIAPVEETEESSEETE